MPFSPHKILGWTEYEHDIMTSSDPEIPNRRNSASYGTGSTSNYIINIIMSTVWLNECNNTIYVKDNSVDSWLVLDWLFNYLSSPDTYPRVRTSTYFGKGFLVDLIGLDGHPGGAEGSETVGSWRAGSVSWIWSTPPLSSMESDGSEEGFFLILWRHVSELLRRQLQLARIQMPKTKCRSNGFI